MPTRRAVLTGGLRAGPALLVAHAAGLRSGSEGSRLLSAFQQSDPRQHEKAGTDADGVTANDAPHPAHFPTLDFGPQPTKLPPEAEAVSGQHSLEVHARRNGLIAGAAVAVQTLESDPALQKLVAEQYDILVPPNELKWRDLRPAQDQFDFTASDALFAFAANHGMLVRGHTLVWHDSVPDWLRNQRSNLDVRQLLIEHIRTVVGRYRGRVHSWDVVNEGIQPDDGQPGGLRKSFWYDAIGPDYIEVAFRTAHEADPHAKLTYNDYGVEYDNDWYAVRRKLILSLLRRMRAEGVPIDAVGIQSHLKAGSPDAVGHGLATYIESIRAMGLDVYLTEMDINEDDLPYNDVARRDATIAKTYSRYLHVALANPAVKLMLTWGVSDRETWLNDRRPTRPNRPQRSLPFDAQYRPKRAFFAIRDSFDKRTPA